MNNLDLTGPASSASNPFGFLSWTSMQERMLEDARPAVDVEISLLRL